MNNGVVYVVSYNVTSMAVVFVRNSTDCTYRPLITYNLKLETSGNDCK
jgi:hypothetical protein